MMWWLGWLGCDGGDGIEPTPTGPDCVASPCGWTEAAAVWNGRPVAGWAGHKLDVGTVDGREVLLAGAPSAGGYADSIAAVLTPSALEETGALVAEGNTGLGNGLAFHPDGSMFAVGEPFGAATGAQEGVAYVFDHLPDSTTAPLEEARLAIYGDSFRFARFGVDVEFLDTTGSGVELVAAASTQLGYQGAIYAFDPELSGEFGLDAASRRIDGQPGLGQRIAGWDGDGDGLDDLVAHTLDAVLYFSSPWEGDRTEDDADVVWSEGSDADDLGQPVVRLDDVDGDGLPELAMGAPNREVPQVRAGALYLVSGGLLASGPADELPTRFVGAELGEGVGQGAATGDFDGDGITDLAVGASGVYPGVQAGKVLGYLGPLPHGQYAPDDADFVVHGEDYGDMFGRALVSLQADGDGRHDLVVGAPGWGGGRGRVYLFLAADLLDTASD